jgi:putative transposase
MKKTRYSEAQILAILRQAEGGVPVAELCREHGMMPLPGRWLPAIAERECVVLQMASEVWRHGRFHGQPDEGHGSSHWCAIGSSPMARENRRLKRMYADLSMQADLLKEALGKK